MPGKFELISETEAASANRAARALDEFFAFLETADAIGQVVKSLKEEPACLLGDICREYNQTHQPVPDHRLNPVGYLGEAALKGMVSLGLITRQSGGSTAIYNYEPTVMGLEHYGKLKASGFFKRYPLEH